MVFNGHLSFQKSNVNWHQQKNIDPSTPHSHLESHVSIYETLYIGIRTVSKTIFIPI
jgi:hypothetical protein